VGKKIYLDTKEKRHARDNVAKRNSGILNSKVANDIKNNNSLKYRFDDAYKKGIEWFQLGLSIDDAPEKLKKDGSFVKGFERGKTIKLVNDTLYDTGREYYLKGIPVDDIPAKYVNNEFFMSGYNDAANISHKR